MLEASVVFVSILGGGLLGMIAGVALAMFKYEKEDSDDDDCSCCAYPFCILCGCDKNVEQQEKG